MNTTNPSEAVERQVDRELRLVADAIALVAAGGTRRVLVAGLRLGDEILGPARDLAAAAGVRLVPEWTADESGLDLAVEPLKHAAGPDGAGAAR